jgi:HK97 family phage prohead protease
MSDTLIRSVEWKAVPGDTGELEGYASVWDVPDDGSDVVLKGAFRKSLADRRQSGQPLPLIADHQLSTEGVIGSVTHAEEDHYGLKVRASFSSVAKAQDIRTRMVEGHLRGMSFTYEAVKSYPGTVAGKTVRFLQELRLYEITTTPFPMNRLAVASAKANGSGDASDVLEELAELEAWADRAMATSTLHGLLDDPDGMANAGRVLVEAKMQQDLASMTAWADALPPRQPVDPTRPREMSRAERLNREAKHREFVGGPQSRCGVCWACQLHGPCAVYGSR